MHQEVCREVNKEVLDEFQGVETTSAVFRSFLRTATTNFIRYCNDPHIQLSALLLRLRDKLSSYSSVYKR